MKERCYKKEDKNYPEYGGRGITICDDWLEDFVIFYQWSMENGYCDELTIDRINVNGIYEPNNCRWVSQKIQCNNKRNNIILVFNNESRSLKEWSKITGIKYTTLYQRYKKGLPIDQILEG